MQRMPPVAATQNEDVGSISNGTPALFSRFPLATAQTCHNAVNLGILGVVSLIACCSSGRRRLGDRMCSCPYRERAMAESVPNPSNSNRILIGLSRDDFGLLEPHLEAVDLPLRRHLEIRNRRIEHVYFPDSGFASVVANGAGDRQIEVGLI